MNETEILAHILSGELSLICPFEAAIALAYMYMSGRNRTFYGWDTPDDYHWFIAYAWWLFPDPAPGARFLFGRADLELPSVQRLIGRDPPLAVWECAGGLSLWAY